jgi:hypothetical protein
MDDRILVRRSAHQNGGRKQYLAHHEADGKLAVIFKISDSLKGERNYSETGLWGLSGAYFSTLINYSDEPFSFNGAAPSPSSWNIYQIENIQKDELRYISVETGNRYEMRRGRKNLRCRKASLVFTAIP